MNFVKSFPHQTPVLMNYDTGDFPGALDKALELADYKGVAQRKAASAAKGKLRGVGFSAYIEACGVAPSQAVGALGGGVGLWESAEVRVNPIGTVEVLTGCHSHGQGNETTYAQLVSSRLGIPIENVSVVHGDTDKVQFGMGTYGSRSGAVGMAALSKALDKIEVKAKKVAGHVLEASEGDIEFKDGKFTVKGTDKSIDFGSVALQAYIAHKFNGQELEPGFKEGAFWDPTNFTFPAGVHICELEIDPQTGVVTIDRWTAVDDFGKLINPMIVEGQVHGGIAQGVGQALMEARALQRRRPIADRELHGLLHAARRRPALVQSRNDRDALSVEPAWAQGLRRSGRDRRSAGGHQRHHRRARPRRRIDAGDPAGRVARRAEVGDRSAPRNEFEPEAALRRLLCRPHSEISPMYAFEYYRPQSLSAAVADLAKPDAKALAGGMTLLPTMKQRLASPAALIDLKNVPELAGITRDGEQPSGWGHGPPRRRRAQQRRAGGDPGARQARQRHRRSACAQHGHDRRFARQQ